MLICHDRHDLHGIECQYRADWGRTHHFARTDHNKIRHFLETTFPIFFYNVQVFTLDFNGKLLHRLCQLVPIRFLCCFRFGLCFGGSCYALDYIQEKFWTRTRCASQRPAPALRAWACRTRSSGLGLEKGSASWKALVCAYGSGNALNARSTG